MSGEEGRRLKEFYHMESFHRIGGISDKTDPYPDFSHHTLDSDGMPDAWEARYGLDPNDPSDAVSDQDNDGVSAYGEVILGSIPSGIRYRW
jgi:hypothetical protein